jgi:two-component system NtrC family sensor kinase
VVVVAVLLCLGVANILSRAGFQEAEDGVLWAEGPEGGVVAADIADGTPAAAVGLVRGDVLLAINNRPIQAVSDVVDALHVTETDATARYTVLRLGAREVVDLQIAPIPNGARPFYFLLASIGIFTLLVGGAVRLRRPRDPATLHFFWLSVAFFGLFTFSFSGRLDRLDWVFYWGDALSILLLPGLFLHFALVFPQRSQQWATRGAGRVLVPLIYAPALILGAARVIALARSGANAPRFLGIVETLDRLDYVYLVGCFAAGLFALTRALAEVRSITARRQLQWIAWGTGLGATPFICGYALPWAMGVNPSLPMQLSAIPLSLIPLAYASAIVRYRLLDVEVIVKRTLGYSVALAVVVAIYAGLLQGFEWVFSIGDAGRSWVLAAVVTIIALLLVPPVKQAIQNTLDRAFYRDRYDYRRALVGFARDLNSDLDLNRLAERLVSRVTETLLVDRMALMLADGTSSHFVSLRASGFPDRPPRALSKVSSVGARLCAGHTVSLDDPIAASRFEAEDVEFWRDEGLYHFIPCVSAERTIALLAVGRKNFGESLNSEDTALLAAVAGQIATALENARLYRQLHVKAAELDRVRAFNENILESLDDGLMVTDLDDRVVRWNRALEQLYGVPRAEAVGQRLHDLFEAPLVEAIGAARRDAPDGATLSRIPITARGEAAEKTAIVNAAVVPLRASDAQSTTTVGTIVILEDVTRQVELEEQLQISEKMASIGLLAAGVAHEVNTPLTGISSFTQMLLEDADPEDSRTRLLEKIERQTQRAAKIVNSLLNLSRPPLAAGEDQTLTSVDLNKVINEVLALLEHQLGVQSISVRRELWAEPVLVVGEEHKLQQVFLNLFLNAKDAMPKGGWLSVLTAVTDDKVTVELADTGSGIPSEDLARIYDPFFTTKGIGQGTGLGLSITYGIVREHAGSIDCESAVGRGTRFVIGFPLTSTPVSACAVHS